jgi:hypothetical protein
MAFIVPISHHWSTESIVIDLVYNTLVANYAPFKAPIARNRRLLSAIYGGMAIQRLVMDN